jgi:thiol:disulfide interchange protein DsbC
MFRLAIAALLGAISLSACAQQPASPVAGATAPAADSAADKRVRDALKQLDPNFAPDYIGAAPFPGFREVVVSGQVLYVTDDGRYLMQSQPYDIEKRAMATSTGLLAHRRTLLASLPHADRIVFAPPNAKYTISVFTDIECGYCRKLHQDVAELNRQGIAVEYLAFPRMGLGSKDYTDMISVWCADDRKAALTAAKSDRPVAARSCTNPVAMQYNVGQQLGISGTPAIFAADGSQLGGYLPPAQLKAALEKLPGAAGSP